MATTGPEAGVFDEDDDQPLQPSATTAAPAVWSRASLKRRLVASDSALYPVLRWAFAPVKAIKRTTSDLLTRSDTRRKIGAYLANPGFKGLHVGCGPFHLSGWLNSDLQTADGKADFAQDITRRFPLPDESLHAIYGCEVVEHLEAGGALNFLRESYRVLRDGGVLRLTTPDVIECCRLFLGLREDVKLDQFRPFWREGGFSPERWINSQFRAWGHQHLYSFEELSRRLAHAGFRNVVRCPAQQSASTLPELANLERRYGNDAPDWIWCRTLIVEAVK